MATLRLEFTNDENSKSIEISSDVNNLEEVDNLITDFRSLIVREKFTAEADDKVLFSGHHQEVKVSVIAF